MKSNYAELEKIANSRGSLYFSRKNMIAFGCSIYNDTVYKVSGVFYFVQKIHPANPREFDRLAPWWKVSWYDTSCQYGWQGHGDDGSEYNSLEDAKASLNLLLEGQANK